LKTDEIRLVGMNPGPAIYFICPDIDIPSGGINRIYRLARITAEFGYPAAVLHQKMGFRNRWAPSMPTFRYWQDGFTFNAGDVVVIPESEPAAMQQLPGGLRKVVLALDWSYIFENLPKGDRWRDYGVSQVLTASGVIAEFVAWTMEIPVCRISPPVDHRRFFYDPGKKRRAIVYMAHRNAHGEWIEKIFRQLPRPIPDWEWIPVKGMRLDAYAGLLREAAIFVATGLREGVPGPMLEAMACGAVVVGYSGVGGNEYLVSDGDRRNGFRVENEDYFALCRVLETVIRRVEGKDPEIDRIRRNGLDTVRPLTFEAERTSLAAFWSRFLGRSTERTAAPSSSDSFVRPHVRN